MKTIPFQFRFSNKTCWKCEIWQNKELIDASAVFQPPLDSRKKAPSRIERDPDGVKAATLNLFAAQSPKFWRAIHARSQPKTFDEFKRREIAKQQCRTLDRASLSGVIYAPTNFVCEFWTVEYVKNLARALSRPRRTQELQLKEWLSVNWTTNARLQAKSVLDVTKTVNQHFATTFSAAKIKQTIYRLGLFFPSDRLPGPPPKKMS